MGVTGRASGIFFVEVERYAIASFRKKEGNSMGLILDARGSIQSLLGLCRVAIVASHCAHGHASARSNVPDSFTSKHKTQIVLHDDEKV